MGDSKTEKYINVTKLVTIVTKMISFIKEGYWKILSLFYTHKDMKFHLREIAKKTKLHLPSTTTFLRALEKDNILLSEKDGNQKKYFLRLNPETFAIFQLFDLERLSALPSIRKNAIHYFLEHLEDKPLMAIVFGSTAKNTFRNDSDIDILIITNTKLRTEEAEKHAEALTGIRISVFQMALKAFRQEIMLKEEPVIQSATNSGYPVLNSLYYYEVLYGGSKVS